jgi:von Willebrand factor type D domain
LQFTFMMKFSATVFNVVFLARAAMVVESDPVPDPPDLPKCLAFCFRITDIRAATAAKDNEKFHVEFQVLNWSDAHSGGLELALAKRSSRGVRFSTGAFPGIAPPGIDVDGRPIKEVDTNGDGDVDEDDLEDKIVGVDPVYGPYGNGILDTEPPPGEDKNKNLRLDNDPMPGNLDRPNKWTLKSRTATKMVWQSKDFALPYINLLAGDCTQCIGDLPPIPGPISISQPSGEITPVEAIDNGDNVQDGFVMTIDGMAVGKSIHLNWFLMGADDDVGVFERPPFGAHCRNPRVPDPNVPRTQPIGRAGQGNAYGFGIVTLTRVDDQPLPGPVFPGNIGVGQSARDFFGGVHNVHVGPAVFAAEFSASLTACFENPADAPPGVNPDGNAGGEPHFKTWGGEKFDFHGVCELIVVRNPGFADGKGMHIHGRTKSHVGQHWSFFESIAIQIGDDILEVQGGQQYWLNGERTNTLPKTLSGYKVHSYSRSTSLHHLDITTGKNGKTGAAEKVYIQSYKELMWVGFEGTLDDDFIGADGILGDYETGQKVARDGKTVIKNAKQFGQEWQVRGNDTDRQLFSSHNHGPAWPEQCRMPQGKWTPKSPTKTQRRKLRQVGERIIIGQDDAKKACSGVDSSQRDNCIFDVLVTNDMEIAEAYHF